MKKRATKGQAGTSSTDGMTREEEIAHNFAEQFQYIKEDKNMVLASKSVLYAKDLITKTLEEGKSYLSKNDMVTELMKTFNPQVVLVCLKYKQIYGFEFSTFNNVMALYPITNRYILTIMGALANNMGVMVKSYDNSYKTETVRVVANILGKNIYEMETTVNVSADSLNMFLSGTTQGGFWMLIKNIEN